MFGQLMRRRAQALLPSTPQGGPACFQALASLITGCEACSDELARGRSWWRPAAAGGAARKSTAPGNTTAPGRGAASTVQPHNSHAVPASVAFSTAGCLQPSWHNGLGQLDEGSTATSGLSCRRSRSLHTSSTGDDDAPGPAHQHPASSSSGSGNDSSSSSTHAGPPGDGRPYANYRSMLRSTELPSEAANPRWWGQRLVAAQQRLGGLLESRQSHYLVIGLTLVDLGVIITGGGS